ncbi:cytochrome b-c1 complex subunit 6, mitochondrial-like [Phlebotomus papatasi]|uniref:cytochrome b-c1 complex subunit 6, mitochondrial-like n=1 Tax=Phlebotomus papatasi TaxID=29031 RepID=UPI0024837D7C|nr:cytochrome b-c1 complex subunit 6, mitochondrial-like [Phlebotomus papatasi]XP_055701164.1 cytochrome b-c1 complex subunit 6, mitochondrial-like [Phlebotomus papatasi]
MFEFFGKILQNFQLLPKVHAQDEEDLVDPHTVLREKCGQLPKVESLYAKYQECNDRVNSRTKTTENCQEELFDYLHELDHCVSQTLFSKLK